MRVPNLRLVLVGFRRSYIFTLHKLCFSKLQCTHKLCIDQISLPLGAQWVFDNFCSSVGWGGGNLASAVIIGFGNMIPYGRGRGELASK